MAKRNPAVLFVMLTLAAGSPAARAQTPAPPLESDPALVAELVVANHVLYQQGVVDGFGHVSVRQTKDPSHFLLARSMAPGLVGAADIMSFDLEGNAVEPQGRAVYLERFIHSEIYKAHPEIKAIVHTHSPAVIPFGVTAVPLKPIYHMSGFLGAGVPVFDIRESGGDATNMLIENRKLGAALAQKLGTASVMLMRGHGDVVVGTTIPQVVFRAIYTEIDARLEAEALRLGSGEAIFLNAQEAAAATVVDDTIMGRAWELWKSQAEGGAK